MDNKQTMEIRNPFVGRADYHCFACAPHNPVGLKMRFRRVGELVVGYWQPTPVYQGYSNVLHGGVQATLMDETASWVVFVQARTSGVTMGMEVEFLRPVRTDGGEVRIHGRLERIENKVAVIAVRLFQSSDRAGDHSAIHDALPDEQSDKSVEQNAVSPSAQGLCRYRLFPEHLARARLFYPGYERFFEE